ncbi:DNA-directed DNA polymerase alpha catalytic subunit pol1 [Coemansia biformis]|uniref:DNA polymerase n=1 Tax=Coemansia biformis TaxID=1286918 RepID=A0A9W8CX63_9FUNG|nr:DNA-directed DNA polymerase alpha catalytic subunit pol1 [Coemansia biformis]
MSSPSARKPRTRGAGDRTAANKSKFDKLRRLRAAGRSAAALSDDEPSDGDDDGMYVAMDEDEYQRRTRQAGLDDFVVDDDGAGYVDGGADDIGLDEASPEPTPTRARAQKQRSRRPEKRRPSPPPPLQPAGERRLDAMFKSAQMKPAKQQAPAADDDAFMSELISGLEVPGTPSRASGRARRQSRTPATAGSSSVRRRAVAAQGRPVSMVIPKPEPVNVVDISDPALDPFALPSAKRARLDMDDPFQDPQPAAGVPDLAPKPEVSPPVDPLVDDLADIDADALFDGLEVDDPGTGSVPLYTDAEPAGQSWMDVQLEMANPPDAEPAPLSAQDSAEAAGAGDILRMYWIDVLEKNGNLYVIGKALAGGAFRSCCLRVSGIERNVFLLPRVDPATGERYPIVDVHRELDALALRHGVRQFACKPVERRYAFELASVPASTEYLKVVYGFSQPALPEDFSGNTFERAFGITYSALELFLLKRRIMGPCWLEVRGARAVDSHSRQSWCRLEYTADDPKRVGLVSDDAFASTGLPRVPPMTVMTLSLKTVMDQRAGANEVVAASMLVYHNMVLDDQTPAAQRAGEQRTLVRPPPGVPMPSDFVRAAQMQSQRGLQIDAVRTEAALLSSLVAQLQRVDPDIVVAHNFYGFDLDVLLHRMRALRTDGWSRLGRLQRTQWPRLQPGGGGMGESTYGERQIMAGRVVCDTYLASRDLIRAKSYSLTSLASQELRIRRDEIPFDRIPEMFASSTALLHLLRHAAFDAFLAAALMIHLQVLPLTRQLTTLAGNLWSRTLVGARAERNEFLLLHEFYRGKFIRPDKTLGRAGKQKGLRAEISEAIDSRAADHEGGDEADEGGGGGGGGDDGDVAARGGRRRPAYLGGLVLEPRRGFYDRYVLLLDFNSLYPSIIQEFNICFTTVRRTGDEMPDAPSPDQEPGVLPRLLKTLVERRRQVKRLLKSAASAEEAAQLDVRQRALKLTANSMYGCLGFAFSRFYAKPLAMLITARGREILQATRDLALSDGLEVIYGDTDSIMIATRAEKLSAVYEMGAQFRRRVNERYRLLELDIDGVFRKLLLLKKKKYAALQIVNPEAHMDGAGADATKLETKGLDLVRRDWCELSHDVSDYVLKQLFSDEAGEAAIATIHEHLTRVGQAVRAGQVPLDKYAIHKGLTKAPEAYADKKSQPHVLVAMRLREKGISVRAGDTVPYIICDAKSKLLGGAEGSGSYAERARHPDEVRGSGGQLVPDAEWYLNQQVLPPCMRLLEPMDTDSATLAQCLGLDASRYRTAAPRQSGSGGGGDELRTLDSQIPDSERFKDAAPFVAKCPKCVQQYEVSGALACTHCESVPSPASLATQLAVQIRRHIRQYYAFVVQCDDCALQMANATRCHRCSGRVHEVYTDKMLYVQLQFLAYTFNPTTGGLPHDRLDHYRRLAAVVESYLAVSARRFVDLSALFSFCRV